jgi:hypothetical protein
MANGEPLMLYVRLARDPNGRKAGPAGSRPSSLPQFRPPAVPVSGRWTRTERVAPNPRAKLDRLRHTKGFENGVY